MLSRPGTPRSRSSRTRLLGALGVSALAITGSALLPTTAASASTAYYGGFNANGFTEFVAPPNVLGTSSSVQTAGTAAYQGSYGATARIGAGGGNRYARTGWGGSHGTSASLNLGAGSDIWYGTALKLPTGFNSSMQSYFVPMRWDNFGVTNVSRSGLAMYGDGSWRLFREQDGVEPQTNLLSSTFRLPENTWHHLEVHQRLDARDGSALNELYLNGTLIGSSTSRNFYGQVVSNIRYGIVAIDAARQTNALSVAYDECYLSNTRRSLPAGTTAPAPAPTPTPTEPAPTAPTAPAPTEPTPTAPAPTPTTAPGVDTEAPVGPPNLRKTAATTSSVSLAWDAATDNVGVAAYEIWKGDANYGNWTLAGRTTGATSFTVGGLPTGSTATYGIRAYDAANNKSGGSNVIAAATTKPADTMAPTTPTNLRLASSTTTSLGFTWTKSTDNVAVARYELWRLDAAGVWSQAGRTTGTTLTIARPANTNTYVVRAFDAAGNRSNASDHVVVR